MSSRYFIYNIIFLSCPSVRPAIPYHTAHLREQNHKKVIKNLYFYALFYVWVHSLCLSFSLWLTLQIKRIPVPQTTILFHILFFLLCFLLQGILLTFWLYLCWWMERTKINCFLFAVQFWWLCYEMLFISRVWLVVCPYRGHSVRVHKKFFDFPNVMVKGSEVSRCIIYMNYLQLFTRKQRK